MQDQRDIRAILTCHHNKSNLIQIVRINDQFVTAMIDICRNKSIMIDMPFNRLKKFDRFYLEIDLESD